MSSPILNGSQHLPPSQDPPQNVEPTTAEFTRPLIDAFVVLHGVRHTKPGATLEDFVEAVASVKDLVIEEPAQVRLLPDEDAARLPERDDLVPPPASDASLGDRFPMHLRWATIKNPVAGAPTRAVFA
jgi:hypothetical protein